MTAGTLRELREGRGLTLEELADAFPGGMVRPGFNKEPVKEPGMDTYIGTKMLCAKEMTRGEYNKLRGWDIPADENPEDAGYLVEYSDGGKANHPDFKGYISWSPKDVFERAYRRTDNMTFGLAIEALKQGLKVARHGWNGKGMFLWLKPAVVIKAEWCKDEKLKELVEANGGEMPALGTICMYTHDGKGGRAILTGWLASQSDMLGEDWMLVE